MKFVRASWGQSFRVAMRYWRPYRLTLAHNPPIYRWLWWNFTISDHKDIK